MSKVKLHIILLILILLVQTNLLFAQEIPDSNEGEIIPLAEGSYTDFVETTYNDPNWVLVTSDLILRANTCIASDGQTWYEKVFNPCYGKNRYWKLSQGAKTGRAFTMSLINIGSLDSLYVREGLGFQLYNGTTVEPCSPYLGGAKYVSLTCWRDIYPAPDGFEPGTFFLPGDEGALANYSIIVCRYPLRLHKTHNALPTGVKHEDYVTYEISYFNQSDGLRDPCDPNSGPVDTNNVTITDFLPLEMDFNSATNGGVYNSRFHTVTWNIGNLSIGDSGSVQLNVRVNRFAVSGSIITNYSEIKSGSLSAAAAADVNVLYKPSIMTLTKVDTNAPNPVLPGDYITYRLTYGPNSQSHTNVQLVDYLPPEVDFTNPSDPNYDSSNHSYTWLIGSLSAGAPQASVTLTVRVNELAEPNAVITNHCKIESNSSYTTATAESRVSPWYPDPPIIYVDKLAKRGSDTGMSWANAYLDLQDAIERARQGYGSEIWVAEGTYYTHTELGSAYWDVNFALVDGVALYGGFTGTETARSQRNWLTNQTILNGDLPGGELNSDTTWIIIAEDCGESTIIDGFTITMGYDAGILVDGASPIIRHNKIIHNNLYGIKCINQSTPNIKECKILENNYYGIRCTNSDPNISECQILDNYYVGIDCNNSDPSISLCLIKNNTAYGIYGDDSSIPVIKNNWICRNGNSLSTCGISLASDSLSIVVRNNTIANNAGYGIGMESYAYITNCIVWGNSSGSLWYPSPGNNVIYSCIQDGYYGEGNIDSDPCFVDDTNDNYHLSPNSRCIDAGDPDLISDPNETDIDGEPRILDGDFNGTVIVDMGADEFYWSPADFDRNEIVNFLDYAKLAAAWLTHSGQPNYDPNCDISIPRNNIIDVKDLARFCDDWLWQPSWNQSEPLMIMGADYIQCAGFTEILSTPSPTCGELAETTQQPQIELQSEPQLEAQLELEPSQLEPQPQLTEEDIQQLVDELEEIWLTDEDLRNVMTEAEWQELIEGVRQSPVE